MFPQGRQLSQMYLTTTILKRLDMSKMITSEGYGIKYKKPEYKDDYIKVFKVTQFSGHWSRCQRFDKDVKNSFLMTATTEIRVAFLIGCYLRAKI